MEYYKKLALVLAMMVVAATTTATAARNELTETLSIKASLNSSLTNIIKKPLGNIFDVNGEPVVECNPDDQNCIKKYGFCLFQNKICCDNCTCFGLCVLCGQK
ncbi:hypothetical protein E1A91_A09G227900v1 [Gossypium mustelinum]|uniref:Uncharacterized protein n=4 Tax=Gossypium TaxID=3633 RepID=A0A2P5WCA3_GOSBA|nr:hypothetical protein ES319_A09G223900v1 [Gossypium barbadense]PPR88708.1 hypothetical protein GOBAR_AA31972 [Gossypium barbadense]TYH03808.1 hypothetical protein ES288_A09G248400v1 [Gossypium darwinii]TYI11979.1 hypothetical protein ES332_A09G244300v1 [Gossypium tomentosum]TYJ19962.1 hypothetical protein E1A91_A09G227900v1 [Gossypium mustelinum]